MKLVTIAIAAALSLSAGATIAQPAPPKGDPAARPVPPRQRPDPAQMEAQRADHLKTVLQLRADQEPALRAYLDAVRPPGDAAKRPERPDPQALRQMTTPQRLDRMQARQAERSAMFAKRADATRSFYATLSPEQQKTFDAESMQRFGHRDAGGPGGHHHHPAPTSAKS